MAGIHPGEQRQIHRDHISFGIDVSSNDFISTGDRRGGGTFGSLVPGDMATTTIPVASPADLAVGQDSRLGIAIDENNTITEVDGNNNQA